MACNCHTKNALSVSRVSPLDQCSACAKKHIVKAHQLFCEFTYTNENRNAITGNLRLAVDHLMYEHRETAVLARDLAVILEEWRDADLMNEWKTLVDAVTADLYHDHPEIKNRFETLRKEKKMQTIKLYVAAAETLGTVKDAVNAKKADPPTFVKGSEILLKLRLFANASGEEPYPIESLAEVVAWNFVMDSDFAEATAHKIVADNAAITVSSVTDTINEIPRNYTELQIPITKTNTEELAAWLGTDEKKSGLNAELIGANASGKEIFVLQIKNFTIRNRISSAGDPVAIDPDYLTAVQVRSLIAAGLNLQFSGDAENWHDLQLKSDHYFRIRSASDASAAWSSAIQLAAGEKGEAGKDAFCYVAYAADAAGTDFSLIPSEYLPYRAEIHTETEIPSPTLKDFKDAVWLKYIGSDGKGVGDMLQSVYDPDGDGIIDRAASAASADAVAWGAVTKKPETYAPAAHRHAVADLADPVRLLVYEMNGIDRLILTKPVICSSGVNYSGEIALNFPAGIFTDEEMETVYFPVSGELLTWELHFPCSVAVSTITTGSESCAVEGVNLPESLPLIDGKKTRHVFTVRARYSANAVGNIVYLVNYAYSCKE